MQRQLFAVVLKNASLRCRYAGSVSPLLRLRHLVAEAEYWRSLSGILALCCSLGLGQLVLMGAYGARKRFQRYPMKMGMQQTVLSQSWLSKFLSNRTSLSAFLIRLVQEKLFAAQFGQLGQPRTWKWRMQQKWNFKVLCHPLQFFRLDARIPPKIMVDFKTA